MGSKFSDLIPLGATGLFFFLCFPVQIFVEFGTKEEATKANNALAGRKFANRVVVTSFFPLGKYKQRNFTSE